jgi:signal transduction histidine kinase/DNA-binding response OmpR family regulator
MRVPAFILACIFAGWGSLSGRPDIDSMIRALDYSLEDTARLRMLGDISDYFRTRDYDSAIHFLEQYVFLAEEMKDREALAEAYYFLGGPLYQLGSVNTSIDCFSNARELYEKLEDSNGLAKVYNGFGRIYLEEGNYPEALDHFNISKEIYESLGNEKYLPHLLQNIGIVYDYMEEYLVARRYHQRALQLLDQSGDTSRVVISAMLNLGGNYEMTGELEEAMEYYSRALNMSKKYNIRPRIGDAYEYITQYYFLNGQYEIAKLYLDSAYAISQEQNRLMSIRDQSRLYSEIYEAMGDYEAAFFYSQQYNEIYDQLRKQESNKRLERLRFDREMNRLMRESAIELHRVKMARNFTFAGLVLLCITLAVIYRNYRIKKKSNALLAEMDQLKSRMFSNISHDLRTPLTLILDPIEQMMENGKQGKPDLKTLKTMQRNARKILGLVNQMLDLSKIDAGRLKIDLTYGKLIHQLKFIASSYNSLAEKNRIHYITKYPEEEIETWFDADKLDKILSNLLGNAFKYTPPGGSVSLTVTLKDGRSRKTHFPAPDNWLHISVHDTGKGIPEEDLPRIFDRFYQVGGTDDPDRIGTGIGLALTRELTDLMKGEIVAESELDHGTHINLTIPLGKNHLNESEYTLAKAEQEIIREREPEGIHEEGYDHDDGYGEPDEPADEDCPIVLVVEDSEDIRIHIRDNLPGFSVQEADNGKTGLEKALELLPDLVITDIRMPEMDGIELCRRLKEDERTSHIPVIMLTAKSSVESKLEGLEKGADDYLTKPFNIKELKLRVRNLISQMQKFRERYRKEFLLEPSAISVESADVKFLNRTREIIEEQLSDPEFSVEELGRSMAMSRMQLFRKIKSLTDQSPSEYIRTIRLKRAAQLIRSDYGNLAEITYEVGFNHPSYFAKCFRDLYGVAPSEYSKN